MHGASHRWPRRVSLPAFRFRLCALLRSGTRSLNELRSGAASLTSPKVRFDAVRGSRYRVPVPDPHTLPPEWERALPSTFDFDGLYRAADSLYFPDAPPVYPSRDVVFRAFLETSPSEVRVVVVGLDPYPDPAQLGAGKGIADGLAFSSRGFPPQRSLKVMLGYLGKGSSSYPASGDLTPWAQRGVLLLNSSLTFDTAASNARCPDHLALWRELITQTLTAVSARKDSATGQLLPTAFLLLGSEAHKFKRAILNANSHNLQLLRPSSRGGWPASAIPAINAFAGLDATFWSL